MESDKSGSRTVHLLGSPEEIRRNAGARVDAVSWSGGSDDKPASPMRSTRLYTGRHNNVGFVNVRDNWQTIK